MKRPIIIAGGGLAGLALGLALRRRDVPVTLVEAANYPRHRVCGEFISGIAMAELDALGIADLFTSAQRHVSTAWFENGRSWFRAKLPAAAYGLSRHFLDHAMAERFAQMGGVIRTGVRHEVEAEGVVWASGRPRAETGWLGLKAHYEGLELSDDLEIHIQDGGYVGLTRVEDGRVNVCGLFRRARVTGEAALVSACEGAGFSSLAQRLRGARPVAGSLKGVTNFVLGWQAAPADRLCIGDAAAMIPPFTGNGMTMALQSALAAADDVADWSRGDGSWRETAGRVRTRLRKTFGRRLRWARIFQAIMLHRSARRLALGVMSSGLIPFETLYTKVR